MCAPGLVSTHETILNGFTLDQFPLVYIRAFYKNWHSHPYWVLEGWSVFEIWVPFENDRKALCHRHKGTLYTFQDEMPVYCCWRIFENVTIVDALSRENISPKDACFHSKVLAASCFFNPCEWGFTISLSFSFYFFFFFFSKRK